MIKGVMTCGRVSLLAQDAVEARERFLLALFTKRLSDTEVVSTQPMCCDRLSQQGDHAMPRLAREQRDQCQELINASRQ